MKRLLASLAFTAVLALAPTQANALDLTAGVFPDDQLAAQSSSGNHFAVGGGTVSIGTHFAFSAHLGPNGPSGYAVVSDPALGEAQGHVCLYLPQTSNFAAFAIVVERGSGFYGSFPNFQFFAGDFGGEPPSGTPDSLQLGPRFACGVGGEPPGGPVVKGNIVVRL